MNNRKNYFPAYFPGINWLKGILILGVIFVHTLAGSMLEHVLYSFLMPVFIFITGFLLKQEYILNVPYFSFISKYKNRIVIPWLLASVIYLLINTLFINTVILSLPTVVEFFLYPFYHLWFIPGLIVMMSILWLVVNKHFNDKLVLIISLILSITWFSYWKNQNLDNTVLYWLGDKRFYIYFFFYVFGFYVRNNPAIQFYKYVPVYISSLAILIGCMSSIGAIHKLLPSYTSGFFFLSLNFGILTLCLNYIFQNDKINTNLTDFCSRQSLAIYLYHYIPILLLKDHLMMVITSYDIPSSMALFVVAVILLTTACLTVLPLVAVLSKSEQVNSHFFGNASKA